MARPMKPWFRPGRGWFVELAGKQIRLTDKLGTEAEAKREMHRILATEGVSPPAPVVQSTWTVQSVCLAYLDHAQLHLKPLTYEFYVRHLKPFSAKYPSITAEEIRPHHVTAWVAEKDWSKTTARGAITAVKRAFRWAARQGHIPTDHLAGLDKPTGKRRAKIPAQVDVDTFIKSVKDPAFHAILWVIYKTGCRPGEAMVVTARDIDFEASRWTIDNKTEHATGLRRVVHLTPDTLAMCRKWAERNPRGPIFRNMRGTPWTRNAFACRFARLRAKDPSLDWSAGSLRHLFITDSLQKEVPIATVATLVGHTSTTMIMRVYSKLANRNDYLLESLARVRGDDEPPK